VSKKAKNNNWSSVSDAELVETALPNWQTLNTVLGNLSRRQVAVLLAHEFIGQRRDPILKRLHQRLARLRAIDEFKEMRLTKEVPASLSDIDMGWLTVEL
jgi:hypothetical protein